MAVTVERFLQDYPEFESTEYQLLQKKLNASELRTNRDAFGDRADHAVMLRAAHLLTLSPAGEKVRLLKDTHETIYSRELRMMKLESTIGLGRNT